MDHKDLKENRENQVFQEHQAQTDLAETLDRRGQREKLDQEVILGRRDLKAIRVKAEPRDHLEKAEKMEDQECPVFLASRDPPDQRDRKESKE